MTTEQKISLAFTLLKVAGGALVANGVVNAGFWDAVAGPQALSFYSGLILVAAPAVRDWYAHSNAGKLVAASTVPGIKPIEVLPSAPPAVQAVAADRSIPTVVAAAPSASPTNQQRR